ncbi:hypothetical protein FN846DRAFT_894310 [Sphaerosporella brunnea]|uniref:Uncharacterized protein n=1 Tax=Sphaerosporella brunnea TaxID=1250544 RepID=A0A5J5EKM2_9PEZI|nr:hypothetical protein FN846DRAFT_894310 [Sphaerosporella brunnea]
MGPGRSGDKTAQQESGAIGAYESSHRPMTARLAKRIIREFDESDGDPILRFWHAIGDGCPWGTGYLLAICFLYERDRRTRKRQRDEQVSLLALSVWQAQVKRTAAARVSDKYKEPMELTAGACAYEWLAN